MRMRKLGPTVANPISERSVRNNTVAKAMVRLDIFPPNVTRTPVPAKPGPVTLERRPAFLTVGLMRAS
jgi:hypothetical protein